MNIVILTSNNPFKDAGILVFDIMNGLIAAGNDCLVITNTYIDRKHDKIISLTPKYENTYKRILRKLNTKIRIKKIIKTNPDYYIFDRNQTIQYSKTNKLLHLIPFKPDFFIYLFDFDFLNAKDLYILNKKTKAPIIYFMVDMAPITGGCHYAWDCLGYKQKCGKCPGLFSQNPNDQSSSNLLFKKEYIDKTNIYAIAGSQWLFNQLQDSSVFVEKIKQKIFIPINENIFKPANKIKIRTLLNLPLNKKIIFFGAVSIQERRKGFKILIETLAILKSKLAEEERNIPHLIIAGTNPENKEFSIPFSYTYLGYLSHEGLARAFQAADIAICPSIEDSGPMMINQSLMCGTPVVAFEMGIAIDLIHNSVTGYRAKLGDSFDLAMGIYDLLNSSNDNLMQISKNCRMLSMKLFSIGKTIENLDKLMNEI